MNGRLALDAFLRTDPRDAGCDDTMNRLHAYVELVLAGIDPEVHYPGITAHLRDCGPCAEDFDGLLAALHAQ